MKKLIAVSLAITLALLLASPSWAAVGVRKNGTNIGTATDLSLKGPTSCSDWDGSTLTIYQSGPFTGTSTIVSQASQLSSASLAFGLLKLSGGSSAKSFSMAAGSYQGQEITLVREDMSALALVLDFSIDNPNIAHTGFTKVTFSTTTAVSSVTLVWIDSTVGWIITGYYGVTIT